MSLKESDFICKQYVMILYALNDHTNFEILISCVSVQDLHVWFRKAATYPNISVSKKDFTFSQFDIDITLCSVQSLLAPQFPVVKGFEIHDKTFFHAPNAKNQSLVGKYVGICIALFKKYSQFNDLRSVRKKVNSEMTVGCSM